jgi:hypothetical protein
VLRFLLAITANLALPVAAHGPQPDKPLEARFNEARSALAARKPISEIRRYFAPLFPADLGQNFSHAGLEPILGFELTSGSFHETIKGSKGCLVYAKPYPSEADGTWTELYDFSFETISGEWVISASTHSVSPVHNAVESEDLCSTLGWPWQPSP